MFRFVFIDVSIRTWFYTNTNLVDLCEEIKIYFQSVIEETMEFDTPNGR